jgi:PAS domain S-box-containing protein
MSRRPRTPQSAPYDYTPDIERLHLQFVAFMLPWQGVAPMPQSVTEVVEELTTTIEELHTINEDLTTSQQAAIESQRHYQELFDAVPEAYLVTDLQGLIQEGNRMAVHLLHLDQSQLFGLPLAVCIAWEERRAFRTQLASLQHGAEVREWVLRVQPPHQPAVQVACHVAPARDREGRLIGLRWLLRDLKAQQQAQETLEQQVRDLAMKLVHANRALQALQDRTELRERELHHRVRNHLQIAASLLDGHSHNLQDSHAQTVLQACQAQLRTIALLHQLLSSADERKPLALSSYLRRLALLLFETYSIDRERVHLTFAADPVEVTVQTALACGLLLHEVLSNTLQDAFLGDQAGTVAITLEAEPPGEITLTIRDTGVGVSMDLEAREADRLRLRLIRALTEQLQGTLVVARDQETCVRLRFPV